MTGTALEVDPATKAAILVEALPVHPAVLGPGRGRQVRRQRPRRERRSLRPRSRNALASFATDIVLMRSVGMRPLVVHGGGPQIGELMARLGKVPEFVDGLRVTDAETLDIARMVLVGKVNRDIVSAINVHGPLAVGVSGEDAGLHQRPGPATRSWASSATSPPSTPTCYSTLLAEDLIPVVATIGSRRAGQAYNINADTAAGAIAEAVRGGQARVPDRRRRDPPRPPRSRPPDLVRRPPPSSSAMIADRRRSTAG